MEEKRLNTTTLIGLVIVLIIIAGLLLALSHVARVSRMLSIATFDDCKAAGYPVMESYPEQCSTPDGRIFLNDAVRAPQHAPASTTPPRPSTVSPTM